VWRGVTPVGEGRRWLIRAKNPEREKKDAEGHEGAMRKGTKE